MPRPYILSHNDKWFVFLGCTLVALCITKEEALTVQREWIRKSQLLGSNDEMAMGNLSDLAPIVMENGNS
jgi:hypothetical protein